MAWELGGLCLPPVPPGTAVPAGGDVAVTRCLVCSPTGTAALSPPLGYISCVGSMSSLREDQPSWLSSPSSLAAQGAVVWPAQGHLMGQREASGGGGEERASPPCWGLARPKFKKLPGDRAGRSTVAPSPSVVKKSPDFVFKQWCGVLICLLFSNSFAAEARTAFPLHFSPARFCEGTGLFATASAACAHPYFQRSKNITGC